MLTESQKWLNNVVAYAKNLRDSPFYRRYRSLFGGIVLLISIAFLSIILIRGWSELRPHLSEMAIAPLVIGQICTFMAFWLGGFLWHFIQQGFALEVQWQKSLAVHILSNMTKYAPGYGWQYVSKGYLSKQDSTSIRKMTFALASELIFLFSPGLVSASLVAGFYQQAIAIAWLPPRWLWFVLCGFIIALTIAWVGLLNDRARQDEQKFAWRAFGFAWLTSLIGWLFYAASCWFFIFSLKIVDPQDYWQCLFALVVSATISFIVIIVPAGFGVREIVLATLLGGITTPTIGVVVSLLMRLSIFISELLSLALALWWRKNQSAV